MKQKNLKLINTLYDMFQEENSDMTSDDSYDAYEEDIALVSFYFKDPTVFEYTRHVSREFHLILNS